MQIEQIDRQNPEDRVAFGKKKEDLVINCLNKYYGYNLLPSSYLEDCKEKTDCWQLGKSGKRYRSAIKVRTTKNDILVVLRDPFYGLNHEDTTIGRDVLYEYFQYITLSKDGKTIRVANGKIIHAISNSLWKEFLPNIESINLKESPYRLNEPVLIGESSIYKGCEIWFHRDSWDGHPKILAFIPPSLLKKGKEIKFHKFIQE